MKRDSIKLEKEERKWIVMEKVPEIKIKLTSFFIQFSSVHKRFL